MMHYELNSYEDWDSDSMDSSTLSKRQEALGTKLATDCLACNLKISYMFFFNLQNADFGN